MEKKAFELGIIIGRFQTFHAGHEQIVEKAIELCDNVGIFIGSSQESGTAKNPFSYETREMIIRKIFGDRVYVYPLPDLGVGNNCRWGDYVLDNVCECFGLMPDLLVSGKEDRRISWFESERGASVSELYIQKTIDISATQMRGFFIEDDFESWKKYTNPVLWSDYPALREAVLSSADVSRTDSI